MLVPRSVCTTPDSLLVAVLDPPSLRIVPFPSFAPDPFARTPPPSGAMSGHQRRGSTWNALSLGMNQRGESEAVVLDDWKWLIGKDGTLSCCVSMTKQC